MNNLVKVNKINSLIEEVEILVNHQKIIAFNVSPQLIEVGKEYWAEIDIFVKDYLQIEEQENEQIKSISHLNNFSYIAWGKLLGNNILDVGFFITSDLFEYYEYLVNQYISIRIDRFQVSFQS